MRSTMKRIACLLLGLILLVAAGCAAKSEIPFAADQAAPAEEPARGEEGFGFNGTDDTGKGAVEATEESVESTAQADTAQYGNKIIKSVYMNVETYEFDRTLTAMQNLLTGMGGYVESSSVTGRSLHDGGYISRSAHFEFRVPEANFKAFMDSVGELGNVTNQSENGEDISFQYYDTEARLESLKVQEERLLAILEKADKIEDVIALEQELSNVRYQIESLTGQIRQWDNLVSFSRASVDLTEVKEYTELAEQPDTLLERIGDTITKSFKSLVRFLEDLVVVFTAILPFLLLLAIIALAVVLIVRGSVKRRRERNARQKEKGNE